MRSSVQVLCWAAFVLSALAMSSCAPVQNTGDVTLVDSGRLDRLVFGHYWKAVDVPNVRDARRIAVSEFAIEFVQQRAIYISDGPENSLRTAHFGESVLRELPDHLYREFVTRMANRGREVIPNQNVVGAKSYSGYSMRPAEAPTVVRHAPPLSGNIGKIHATDLRGTSNLAVLTGPDLVDNDRALAREVGADVVIRARFRVGIYKGRVTLEKGSVVNLTTPTGAGRMESHRALGSRFSVLENYGYRPTNAGEYNVSGKTLMEVIAEVFESYSALAMESFPK